MTLLKNKKPHGGIHWKIFAYLALFGIAILLFLWLCQIVFLDDFYYMLSSRTIKSTANELASASQGELQSRCDTLATEHGLCISVYNSSGRRIASADTQYNCLLHHVDANSINSFYSSALQNGGEYMADITLQLPGSQSEENSPERMIYTRLVSSGDGRNLIIMIDSAVAPVGGVIDTLTVQLLMVTVIVLFAAIIIATVIARLISSPIERINESAKQLAKGKYDTEFKGGNFREIDELAHTLNYASNELSKVDRLQKELIANISHDLRTPLTMIIGYSEMMQDIPSENSQENLQVIIDESKRLSLLVNDLIEISKYQTGNIKLTPEPLRLDMLLCDTVERFAKLTEHDGYTVKANIEGEAMVSADKNHLLQVIYNLIQNAINYCGEDKTVDVSLSLREKVARVEVTDRGEGIPAEQIPYIWDRYYKIDKVHKRGMGGSGIGLSIVKEILELHNAKYGVISQVGAGSTFYFEFPMI